MKIEDKETVFNEYKPNNIYNVDCYEAIKEIPDKSIDCVYIDIPYIIQDGGASDSPLSQRAKRLRNVELANLRNGIDYSIFDELYRVMNKINIFIWCSKEQILDIMNYCAYKKDKVNYEILTWCKTNPTPLCNNTWLPNIEYCLYFRESGVKINDGYENKSKYYISGINQKDKFEFGHPTIKPLECVKKHLLHCTSENDVVLDCFLGSGTTAVACKEIGRRYIGFEIDEEYYKIAVNRLNGISQKDIKNKEAGIQTIFDFME